LEFQLVVIAHVPCRLAPVAASEGNRMPIFLRYGDWFDWFARWPNHADVASQSLKLIEDRPAPGFMPGGNVSNVLQELLVEAV